MPRPCGQDPGQGFRGGEAQGVSSGPREEQGTEGAQAGGEKREQDGSWEWEYGLLPTAEASASFPLFCMS